MADLGLAGAVHRVVLQHIGEILGGAQVVDAHNLDFGVIQAGAEHHAADAAKTIDANFDAHVNDSFIVNLSAALRGIGSVIYYTPEILIFLVFFFIVLSQKITEILPTSKRPPFK